MARTSQTKAGSTREPGERRLLFMVPGQTILDMSDEDIERLVDQAFTEIERPTHQSEAPRPTQTDTCVGTGMSAAPTDHPNRRTTSRQ
jgi:hypothetical protein